MMQTFSLGLCYSLIISMVGFIWYQSTTAIESGDENRIIPMFQDVTDQAGLTDMTKTYAAAATDVNEDGYPDLAVSFHGNIGYYKNNGDGTFAGPTYPGGRKGRDIHGISFVDINHDGRPDLAMAKGAQRGRGFGANEYYINTGSAFEAIEPASVLADSFGRGRSITPADFNNDGLIDLFISNFNQPDHRIALAVSDSSNEYVESGLKSSLTSISAIGLTSTMMVKIDTFYREGDMLAQFMLQEIVGMLKISRNCLASTIVQVSLV